MLDTPNNTHSTAKTTPEAAATAYAAYVHARDDELDLKAAKSLIASCCNMAWRAHIERRRDGRDYLVTTCPPDSVIAPSEVIKKEDVAVIRKFLKNPTQDLLCFKVAGNSMNLKANAGDLITVDPNNDILIDGKLFVFMHPTAQDFMFRRYRDTDGPVRLETCSDDSGPEPIFPEGALQVFGRVISVTRTFLKEEIEHSRPMAAE